MEDYTRRVPKWTAVLRAAEWYWKTTGQTKSRERLKEDNNDTGVTPKLQTFNKMKL
jgi:hypothetical protein